MIFVKKYIKDNNKSYYLHRTHIQLELTKWGKFKKIISYIINVYLMILLKSALIISDIYTCVNLLAYNKWSNSYVKPYISFRISKWLYSSCILVSIIILLFSFYHSFFKILRKTDNIVIIYIDYISRQYYNLQNIKNFYIFEQISPKSFIEKITFFTFFQLNNNYTLLFGDTPRQIINGLTLWSVLISANGDLQHIDNITGIVTKLKYLAANKNHDEAVILTTMLFSFILWLIFFTIFLLALLSYPYVYFKMIRLGFNNLQDFVIHTIYHNLKKNLTNSDLLMTGGDFEDGREKDQGSTTLMTSYPSSLSLNTNTHENQKNDIYYSDSDLNLTTSSDNTIVKPLSIVTPCKLYCRNDNNYDV